MRVALRQAWAICRDDGAAALLARVLRRIARRLDSAAGEANTPVDESALIREAAEYWRGNAGPGVDLGDYSHWRDAGPWQDHERWLMLGRPHLRLVERLVAVTGAAWPRRVVEWGCGGGANAIHFAPRSDEFCGIEIAQPSLDECEQVLREAGFAGFRGVLIDAAQPEQATPLAGPGRFDLLLCTYVFELIPSRHYGVRLLAAATELLAEGGLALIQIRYDDGSPRSSQKVANYARDSTRFTSYRIEDFWLFAERAGLAPEFVWLAPRRTEEFSGDLYAYFGLRKAPSAGNGGGAPSPGA